MNPAMIIMIHDSGGEKLEALTAVAQKDNPSDRWLF